MAKRWGWALFWSMFTFGILPGLGSLLYSGIPLELFWVGKAYYVAAVAAAMLSVWMLRRPAWSVTLPTAIFGSVLGAAITQACFSPTHTWIGDVFMCGRTTHMERPERSPWDDQIAADIAYLNRGAKAASEGHPLKAPEGGYLCPVTESNNMHSNTSVRFISVSSAATLATDWNRELQNTTLLKADISGMDFLRRYDPMQSATRWVGYSAAFALLVSFVGFWRKR